ncbi:MAG: iron ABC transporter permease [Pseudomonadota bacterium]
MERTVASPAMAVEALAIGGLAVITVALAIAGLALGPVPLAPSDVIAALLGQAGPVEQAIVWEIRLPRIALGIAVGAALAVSGAALQGVLRNPLADPGLIGVTGGASLGAVMTIVLGGAVAGSLPADLRPFMLPFAAFVGAGVVIAFVFALARRHGETSVATLILAGVAVNAIAGAAIGAMVYISDDQQLRDLTFWTMGALGGAGWTLVIAAVVLTLAALPMMLARTRDLDLFQLGERAAFHAGLDVERSKLLIALATAIAVGAVTAAAGPIGFIGLVAPHLVRLALGPRHGVLLPASLLTGVALVLAADLAVRLAVPPAEPPIGLATSLIGGPFFLWLLIRGQGMRRHA